MAKSSNSNPELTGRRLGRVLTKMGKITRDQAQEALELQKSKRAPIGQLLVELGYCNHDDINMALAAQAGMMTMDLTDLTIEESVLRMVPAEMANAYHVLPISHDASTNKLTVALKSADNFRAIDDLRLLMGFYRRGGGRAGRSDRHDDRPPLRRRRRVAGLPGRRALRRFGA